MTDAVGIVAFGGYVPKLRLRRSSIVAANSWANPGLRTKGERAVASWDEDAVTMAVEAARDALGPLDRSQIGGLVFASTSPPFADRLNAGIVAGGLNLDSDLVALDVGGSLRAGTSAAITGHALAVQTGRNVVVAAAERRRSKIGSAQEMANGDAAAALVFGTGNLLAKVLATHSLTSDFVDHFRATGQAHEYSWEERWVRDEGYLKLAPEAAAKALAKAGLAADQITRLVIPSPLARIETPLAKKIGVPESAIADGLAATVGYAGAAHGLLLLAHVLESASPGDRILVLSFANGCDAMVLEATQALADFRPAKGVARWIAEGDATDDYMRFLSFNNEIDVEWGPRAEFGNKYALTMENRFGRDMLGFIGGRDKATGVVQFPKTPMAVAPQAEDSAVYEDVPLADLTAKVIAGTADWLTYHPSPPLYFGLVQFANGARVAMEFVDVGSGTIDVGDEVEMVFRVKEIDRVRNYRHYFWKAKPRIEQDVAAKEAAE